MIRIQTLRLRFSALCRFIAAWPFEAQRQPLCAVKPVNPFVVIAPAFPPEHHVYPAVTVMHPGVGDLTDAQPQCAVVGGHRTIAKRAATDPQRKTNLSLTRTVASLQIPAPFAQACQRQLFFVSTSRNMALSRFRSATSLFSRRFSSSSCRICFSSEGEMPPYFLRHT